MKNSFVLFLVLFCFSFRPSTEKAVQNTSNGFYIFVQNNMDRTNHKYIVESKDSVNLIFNSLFNAELELGDVDRPISIYNGKLNFYLARVNVFQKADGELSFHHLKYPKLKMTKRGKLAPVTL